MSQISTFTWTNANPAVAHNINTGFTVAEITTVDTTNGGSWYWCDRMAAASSIDVDSGAYSAANGFTALSQSSAYGATITGFTNANPGVITVNDTATFGFANGDTIKVERIADDGSGTSLNQDYVIASFTGTAITTGTNTTGYSVYVSGGRASRVSDTDGDAIPTENFSIRGMTVGTTPVGAASAVMVAVCKGKESVT